MRFRTLFIASVVAVVSGLLAAHAQVPGVNSTLQSIFTLAYEVSTSKPTYSASYIVTPSGAMNDICVLTGSATKTIRVRRIWLNGYTATAMTDPVSVVKRSSVSTNGTGVTVTPVSYNSQNAAGTAVAEFYTASPTNGTAVGVLLDVYQGFTTSTSGTEEPNHTFEFGRLGSPVFLRGASQSIAVNLSGLTYTGASFACGFEWTEDNDS